MRPGGENRGVVLGQNHDGDGGGVRCEITSGGVTNGVGERCRAGEIGCGGENHGVAEAVAVGVIRQRDGAVGGALHGNDVQRQVASVIVDQLRFGKVKRGVFVGDKGVCNGIRGSIGLGGDVDRDSCCGGFSDGERVYIVAIIQDIGKGYRPSEIGSRSNGNGPAC